MTGRERRAIALAELEWFHAVGQTLSGVRAPASPSMGTPPEAGQAARTIRGWLDKLLTFHRGALSLRFTPREWPLQLQAQYDEWTGLVVRMDCAVHPNEAPRPIEASEADAVARLLLPARSRRERKERAIYLAHAKKHLRAAFRAYRQARGRQPAVVVPLPAEVA